MTNILVALALIFVAMLFKKVFARFFPAKIEVDDDIDFEQLAKRYRWWDLLFIPPFFLCTAVVSVCLWACLAGIAQLYKDYLLSGELIVTMPAIYWFLPAFFTGILLAVIIINEFVRRWKPVEYAEYKQLESIRYPYDPNKAFILLTWTVCGGSAIFSVLGLDNYFLIQKDTVVINHYFSIGAQKYPYSEISRIRTAAQVSAPNGNIASRRTFIVTFGDGEKLYSGWLADDMSQQEMMDLLDLISVRSGVQVETIQKFDQRDIYRFYW